MLFLTGKAPVILWNPRVFDCARLMMYPFLYSPYVILLTPFYP
jgi:hypothetical protein